MGSPMKPLNFDFKSCKPISSECVIWQGDDIECLQICTGDTISKVMHGIACIVCYIQDQLDPSKFDTACLNLSTCDKPLTFREFMNIMIALQCQDDEPVVETPVVEEPTYTVASCFVVGEVITLSQSQYITAMGALICEQATTIQNQQTAIENLLERVEALEGA